jgi:hypothetical protein
MDRPIKTPGFGVETKGDISVCLQLGKYLLSGGSSTSQGFLRDLKADVVDAALGKQPVRPRKNRSLKPLYVHLEEGNLLDVVCSGKVVESVGWNLD